MEINIISTSAIMILSYIFIVAKSLKVKYAKTAKVSKS